jgi:4-diphosphocytidyl-2-C-methyl-D-erythritol kinase
MLIHRDSVGQVIQTPAKINLFFNITGQRDDGFHEVETLMVPISLYDTLKVHPNSDGEIRLQCCLASAEMSHLSEQPPTDKQLRETDVYASSEVLASDESNLVVRAVSLLRKHACVDAGADIELIKRIPIAAGLGGGSSDAAAALVAANDLWQLQWTRDQLAEVAAELGSDVPFFLYGKAAVCRGRGEIIEPVEERLSCPVVVLRPPVGLSTADVFAAYRSKERSAENQQDLASLLEAFRRGRLEDVGKSLFNVLEPVAAELCPWIEKMARGMEQEGVGHLMSGSGSCCFGLFPTIEQAKQAASRLEDKQLGNAYIVQMCPESHLC